MARDCLDVIKHGDHIEKKGLEYAPDIFNISEINAENREYKTDSR